MSKSRPPELRKTRPYAFAPVPSRDELRSRPPIFHDGADSKHLVSGELRCELTNLTPLLVGWERITAGELAPPLREKLGQVADGKPVLFPLRYPDKDGAVLIPGDSLKGMLRHELGALLGAPMERVAERHYSYRPNAMFPDLKNHTPYLEPRLAKVISNTEIDIRGEKYLAPTKIALFTLAKQADQIYYPRISKKRGYEPGDKDCDPYQGGMGAGVLLPDHLYPNDEEKPRLARTKVWLSSNVAEDQHQGSSLFTITPSLLKQYGKTLEHYFDAVGGHFSRRHPGVQSADDQRTALEAIKRAPKKAFRIDDIIWVEWDTAEKCVVSFGWHYYYRWAYQDSVRLRGGPGGEPRDCLTPTAEETARQGAPRAGAPVKLTAVRRLFGYTEEEAKGVGSGDHAQLMGRISINAAMELVRPSDTDRFLPITFLRELGMPRPSAVEHYIDQDAAAYHRRSDAAKLVTYGDAAGYDQPGELAGRKYYLHRSGAGAATWTDDSIEKYTNERSTVAIDASCKGRTFRFTLRFRDLEPDELAAVMLALSPHQFARQVGGKAKYASKLGYARPLGWGSVQITTRELHLLEEEDLPEGGWRPLLRQEPAMDAWFGAHAPTRAHNSEDPLVSEKALSTWLKLHDLENLAAGDYPTALPEEGDAESRPKSKARNAQAEKEKPQIYTYHSQHRAWHSRLRRYRRQGR